MKVQKDTIKKEFTLDRIEEDKAVLMDEEDEQLILPADLLPKDAKEGEVLILTLSTHEAETKRREQKAKDLLNEILKSQ